MDIVAENFDVGVAKVSVGEASSGLEACGTSIPAPATASSIQAAFFLSSECAAVSTPSPIQLESQSLTSHIPEPPATASRTAAEVREAEMSISVEPSTTASITIFPSSAVVTSAPSCLPNDTAGLVLPPSSSSVLGVSAATGIPLKASSIASSLVGIPTYSTSLTSPSFETSTPYSCSDMIQAPSAFQSGDERSESLGCSPPGDTPHPDVPPAAVGLYSSVYSLTVPTTSSTVEGTRPCPLEMSSSRAAGITSEGSLFPSVDLSKHQPYTVLSSTFAPTDNTVILQTSTLSRSECQPDAPSHWIEGSAAFLVPSKASLEMTASSVALPLPDVRETDPVALSELPVGASTGLLTENERSSLKTSTSFPSGLKSNSLKRLRPAEGGTNALGLHKRCKKECKAGNSNCGLATGRSILLGDHVSLPCDICCTEPGFCRECKCILCCKTIAPDVGESNFVRCVRKPLGNGVCGHAAHLECALNSKMAGVVKKRGLDMEYLCRRCDNRTDLRELVTLLLEAVGNTDVREHAEKSLKLALEVMKGTERGGSGARVLESLVQTALRKVQSGVDIQEAFKELKDQGAAAEAARQQNLGRGLSLMEDVAQQPEASLDQWLPSSGSPSSHPSPGTPSSFTSPRLRSNPSVTSGQLNGTPTVDGSLRKHGAADGHIGHVGQPQSSHEVVPNLKYKNLHLGNKAPFRNAGQERGTQRIRAVSSNFNNNGLEAICDSFTTAPGNHVADPGSRDGKSSLVAAHNSNSGTKNLRDQKNPSSIAGKLREDIFPSEMCKSCGAVKRHTRNAEEITSSLKSPKIEDGANRVLATSREEEPGDLNPYKQIGVGDTGVARGDRPRRAADGSAHKVGTSLQLLDLQCEHDMQAALQKLRRAQEAEFERAKACLTAKKESILRKYELVEASRREFSEHPVSSSLEVFDELLLRTGTQFAGAIEERDNFNTMLTIGEGFGSVSRDDLKKFYRWPPAK